MCQSQPLTGKHVGKVARGARGADIPPMSGTTRCSEAAWCQCIACVRNIISMLYKKFAVLTD